MPKYLKIKKASLVSYWNWNLVKCYLWKCLARLHLYHTGIETSVPYLFDFFGTCFTCIILELKLLSLTCLISSGLKASLVSYWNWNLMLLSLNLDLVNSFTCIILELKLSNLLVSLISCLASLVSYWNWNLFFE